MDDVWGVAMTVEGLAGIAAARGRGERALHLAGAAHALRLAAEMPAHPDEQARLDGWLAAARQALRAEAQATAWAEGQAMSLEQAITYALDVAPEAAEQPPAPVTPL